MIRKFLRHLRYKKMIKGSSSFILEEFSTLISEAISHFEKEGKIQNQSHKEFIKFESTILIFWLFQKTDIFPPAIQKLILDEVHNQYFLGLKKHGYDFNMRQAVSDEFNQRYRAYNDVYENHNDLSGIGTKFVKFLSEKSETESEIKDIFIPMYLIEQATPKLKEFRSVTHSVIQ